jgi:hypothetical protein
MGQQVGSLKLHYEVLGRSQRSLLPTFSALAAGQDFYLAGGTGLALQLGHRRSVDFDWFRAKPIEDPLRLAAALQTPALRFKVDRVERGTLHGSVRRVRVSFLEYGYPQLEPLIEVAGLRLAALEDIAAMKLAAVAQRGSRKDFVDVFALGQRFALADMLGFYRAKYGLKDVGHILVALSYFDDADRERLPTLLRRWDWSAMKAAIRRWVSDAARGR